MYIFLRQAIVAAAAITPLWAQDFPRTAAMSGGGNRPDGKCTIEVVVDGVADVEIRGNHAVLHNLSGQPAEWRRFECNAVMPPNPADFRFQGIDGRGRQSLVRDPRNGGAAIVRIEDPQAGREGYTFDIMWSAGNYSQNRGDYPAGGQFGPTASDREYGAAGGDRDYDRWHDERRGWGREQWRSRIFERVRQDLDHVESATFSGRGDMYRLGQARRELDEMQGKLSAGRYDERELDDVIATLGNVVRDNRMSARDRDILSDDLERLRDFRQRHDYYGAR